MPAVRLGLLRVRSDGRRRDRGRVEEATREARKMTRRKAGSISGTIEDLVDVLCTREVAGQSSEHSKICAHRGSSLVIVPRTWLASPPITRASLRYRSIRGHHQNLPTCKVRRCLTKHVNKLQCHIEIEYSFEENRTCNRTAIGGTRCCERRSTGREGSASA